MPEGTELLQNDNVSMISYYSPDVNNKYSTKIFQRRIRNLQGSPFIEVSQKHASASQATDALLAGWQVDKLSMSLGRSYSSVVYIVLFICACS